MESGINKIHVETIDKKSYGRILEDYNEQEHQNQKMEEMNIKNQIDF